MAKYYYCLFEILLLEYAYAVEIYCFVGSDGGSGVESIYERLYMNTVKNTTIHLPPCGEGHSAVKVKVDFKLIRIIDLVSMSWILSL